jgi:glycosyltransferase involved in cell wall biosynthesis
LVLSSQTALGHFDAAYPNHKVREFVLPFAVTLGALSPLNFDELKAKYGVADAYFVCCNQFWKHKNHALLLKAIAHLANRHTEVQFCFTGNESDRRHPGYFQELRQLARDLGIEARVRFLGFIPRTDQLALMAHALAVVQPSLFEGWSTVVEDVKALNRRLVVSDIPVHREQLTRYPYAQFFDPHDAIALAEALLAVAIGPAPAPSFYNYKIDVLEYGAKFLEMLDIIRGDNPC